MSIISSFLLHSYLSSNTSVVPNFFLQGPPFVDKKKKMPSPSPKFENGINKMEIFQWKEKHDLLTVFLYKPVNIWVKAMADRNLLGS